MDTTTDRAVAQAAVQRGVTVIEITANPCKFEANCMTMRLHIGQDTALERLYLIGPKAAHVQGEANWMATRVSRAYGESFYVSSRAYGRKPPGYKALPYVLAKVDRDTPAPPLPHPDPIDDFNYVGSRHHY